MPYYTFRGHRQTLLDFFARRERADQDFALSDGGANGEADGGANGDADAGKGGEKGLKAYWREKNARSIDGLPALLGAPRAGRVPVAGTGMGRADAVPEGASGNGCASAGAGAEAVVKEEREGKGKAARVGLDGRRVREWAAAFALGVVVAAGYGKATGCA